MTDAEAPGSGALAPGTAGRPWMPASCDLCGEHGRPRELIRRPDGARIVRCDGCGLVYLDPRPSDDEIAAYYADGYYGGPRGVTGIGYEDYSSHHDRSARAAVDGQRLAIVEGALPPDLPRTMLEVGAGDGAFARHAADSGWTVIATDVSDQGAALANRHARITYRVGSVPEVIGSDERFPVICAFEVIEHVTSPVTFLLGLRASCLENGLIALSTPNFAEAQRIGVDRWVGFRTSFEHLVFLDPVTLAAIARRAGLEVVAWFAAGSGDAAPDDGPEWRRMVRRLLGAARLLGPVRRLRRIASRPSSAQYALNGSGHNLFALLRPSTPDRPRDTR